MEIRCMADYPILICLYSVGAYLKLCKAGNWANMITEFIFKSIVLILAVALIRSEY
jgi:hypothetical protein